MNKKIILAVLAMAMISSPLSGMANPPDHRHGGDYGHGHDHHHHHEDCDFSSPEGSDPDASLALTTIGFPFLLTSTLLCSAADNAEANRALIEKEATLLMEEDQLFVPSFLAKYAADRGENDLKAVAQDVLQNGVR